MILKNYKVEIELDNSGVLWSQTIQATGLTSAERKAEDLIEDAFFHTYQEKLYFYTITELETNKTRKIKAMNCIAPKKKSF